MDRTENQLRACVKAMTDVVTPAMDPDDAQAAEQAFMVTDYLGYLQSRLDYLHDRHRFEVQHYAAMAQAIADDVAALAPEQAGALRTGLDAGQAVLADPAARTPALRAAAAGLSAAITGALRAVAGSNDEARRRIERQVVDCSTDKIAVDRAWHLPQGLDGDADSVLPLAEALGVG